MTDIDPYYADLVKREVASERRDDPCVFDTSVHVTFDFDFGDVHSHRMRSTGTTTFCDKDPFDPRNPGTAHADFASTGRRRVCGVCKQGRRAAIEDDALPLPSQHH